ncbi:acyl carrier protein [Chryseobacterium sp. MEBOG07]|uniref:acyl carrier protein n=1 Tax=Chryseobacterium sp. MEBOG07 TaxID=2879939 RepID=UPI001F30D85E|nr:acyl carrier protein [Chryseobacterium sp. MEBOG07]UKB80686.1 acyl carrier protein [Chryseobacterium sp. MEBOG07]
MEEKVKEIMAGVFEVNVNELPENINQENFEDWTSIKHLTLIVEIEEEFDKAFEPEEISEMTSLSKIIEYISK